MTPRCAISLVPVSVCVSVLILLLTGANPKTRPTERPHDFFQLYLVGWNLRHGQAVYGDIATPQELAEELGWSIQEDYSFANPPAMAPLLFSLSLLPYDGAWWMLLGFSFIAGIGTLYLAARETGVEPCISALLAGFFVCSLPFLVLLLLNHVESVILLLGTLGWMRLRKGRLRSGGALWGLCAALKLFPTLWVVPLLFHPHLRRAAWWAMAAGLAATGLGVWVVGTQDTVFFVTQVVPQAASFKQSLGNLSLVALGNILGLPGLGWAMATGTGVLTCAILLRGRGSVDQIWVSTSAAALLMSPLSWSYYFVLLGPCVLVVASHLEWTSVIQRLMVYCLGLSLFLWPSLLGNWGQDALPTLPGLLGVGVNFVPTLGLLGLLSFGLFRIEESPCRPRV